jgi:hypothetical protein
MNLKNPDFLQNTISHFHYFFTTALWTNTTDVEYATQLNNIAHKHYCGNSQNYILLHSYNLTPILQNNRKYKAVLLDSLKKHVHESYNQNVLEQFTHLHGIQ